jgi:hypothetical protein
VTAARVPSSKFPTFFLPISTLTRKASQRISPRLLGYAFDQRLSQQVGHQARFEYISRSILAVRCWGLVACEEAFIREHLAGPRIDNIQGVVMSVSHSSCEVKVTRGCRRNGPTSSNEFVVQFDSKDRGVRR